jgi:adenine phosphoribosyltransferase
MEVKEIEEFIKKVPDYPKPGILFYDISTLLQNKDAFSNSVNLLAKLIKNYNFDFIAAIDARGFIFGAALSIKLDTGLIMIRKSNKLPGKKISYSYDLEYGSDTLEVNVNAQNKNVAIVDDLLATGGTASAAAELIRKAGGKVTCFASLIELKFLKGREKLNLPVKTLIEY